MSLFADEIRKDIIILKKSHLQHHLHANTSRILSLLGKRYNTSDGRNAGFHTYWTAMLEPAT